MCLSVDFWNLNCDIAGYVCTSLSVDPWTRCCPEAGEQFSCQLFLYSWTLPFACSHQTAWYIIMLCSHFLGGATLCHAAVTHMSIVCHAAWIHTRCLVHWLTFVLYHVNMLSFVLKQHMVLTDSGRTSCEGENSKTRNCRYHAWLWPSFSP